MKIILIKDINIGEIEVLVDDENFEYLNQFKWYVDKDGYILRKTYKNNKTQRYLMHREIMEILTDSEKFIDHINGVRHDNRRENLRICQKNQNNKNITKMRTGVTSKYKGVYWEKRRCKWCVEIHSDNKKYFGGYFSDEGDAARSYNSLALKLHGEFAHLNNVQ